MLTVGDSLTTSQGERLLVREVLGGQGIYTISPFGYDMLKRRVQVVVDKPLFPSLTLGGTLTVLDLDTFLVAQRAHRAEDGTLTLDRTGKTVAWFTNAWMAERAPVWIEGVVHEIMQALPSELMVRPIPAEDIAGLTFRPPLTTKAG